MLCQENDCGKLVLAKGLCKHHYDVKRYRENSEKHKQRVKRWREEHPDVVNGYYAKYRAIPTHAEEAKQRAAKWRRTPEGAWREYTTGAKKRGMLWLLTKEQFLVFWQKSCYYCGGTIESVGLDRVDNNCGYVLDNVVPCCGKCNRAKHMLSQKEFLDLIVSIYKHLDLLKTEGGDNEQRSV